VCSLSNLDCTRACWWCSVLQCVAVSCSVFTLQLGLYARMLVVQCVAFCYSELQCVHSPTWIVRAHVAVAVLCNVLQYAAVYSLSNLDCTRTCWWCSVLHFVTVSCNVFTLQLGLYARMLLLQCVAVCCSELQCARSPT